MSVFTLRENLRHKVTQKVAHHHYQNTLRCHLHTLVCTLSQMYNHHKQNTLGCHLHTLVCTLSQMYNVPNRIHFAAIFIHLYAHFTNVQRPQETQQHNDETANWRATGQPQSCAPFSTENNIRCSARSDHISQILRAFHWLNFLSNPAFSIKLLF